MLYIQLACLHCSAYLHYVPIAVAYHVLSEYIFLIAAHGCSIAHRRCSNLGVEKSPSKEKVRASKARVIFLSPARRGGEAAKCGPKTHATPNADERTALYPIFPTPIPLGFISAQQSGPVDGSPTKAHNTYWRRMCVLAFTLFSLFCIYIICNRDAVVVG